ncbi:MAG: hypothetical protein P8L85_16480 [Rubripirellula sp.]|nr:hypothetical protein [Rubripirellula sp.]
MAKDLSKPGADLNPLDQVSEKQVSEKSESSASGRSALTRDTKGDSRFSLVLRDDRIIETVSQLERRIKDRFPESGLATLCGQLRGNAQQAARRALQISQPIRWIRWLSLFVTTLLVCIIGISVYLGVEAAEGEKIGVTEIIQTLEAVMNELILASIAVIFLFSLESRLKRRRTLAAIHELRSIAHVIDMHQLTKDPERFLSGYANAEHSPERNLTPEQLNRYLDYCSEMLSLTGKVAALYVQRFDDSESVNAVGEVEQLTTGLSRKIWQKIMVLHQLRHLEVNNRHPAGASKSNPPSPPLQSPFN